MPSKNIARKRAPRGSGQRTRTGCLTCKQRRVKCDEQKPFCKRCIDGGYECTGYVMPDPIHRGQSRSPSRAPESASAAAAAPTLSPIVSPTSFVPAPRIRWSSGESRSIHSVMQNLIPTLIGEFESTFWERHVLQLCHRDAAVKHAMAALGAVHETRDAALMRLPGDPPGPDEIAARPFAIQQYSHSIQCLGDKMKTPSADAIRSALACCLVFVTLELLQKNHDQALKHLRAGLNIYRSRLPAQAESAAEELVETSEDGIGEVFYRLDSQATGYLDTRRPQIISKRLARAARSPSPISSCSSSTTSPVDQPAPPLFSPTEADASASSLRSLRARLDDLHKQVLLYLVENQMYRFIPRRRVPADIVAYHRAILQRLTVLGQALVATAAQLQPNSSLTTLQAVQRLLVSQRALYAMARRHHMDLPQQDYDPDYQAIIDSAEPLFPDTSATESVFGNFLFLPPTFTLDASVVPALFMTAHSAPLLETRQRAIRLLRRVNVQEGLWSSDTLAEIAVKCLQEEAGHQIPVIAESLPQMSCRLGVDESGGFEPLTSPKHIV